MTNRSQPRPEAVLGRTVLSYTIDRIIGAGGMGAVYAATSSIGGKRAAVKVMLLELLEEKAALDRFLREALIAGSVNHPNVLEAWGCDYFREDGRLFILMPLVEGRSLQSLCSGDPMPLDHALSIALQTADGLAAVHELGVVHRDFKPANVLITTHNNIYPFAKIFDFGVARLLRPCAPGEGLRTLTGVVVGSPGHMAPEQAAGAREVDARADVYSWGVLLYQMLTGRRPLEGESWWDLIESARSGARFPRPRELRPELPRACDDVIMACLEFFPKNRPTLSEAVRRITAPLAGRDVLLSVLAPKLSRPARVGADGSTFVGYLEPRWFAVSSKPRSRRALALSAAGAAAVGLGATALAFHLTTSGGAPVAPSHDTVASTVDRAAPVNDRPDPPIEDRTAESLREVAVSLTDRIELTPDGKSSTSSAGSSSGAVPPAPRSAPSPPVPRPASDASGSGSASANHASAQRPQEFMIVVRANPWAVVKIDGVDYGQTPVRRVLKVGPHVFELTGPEGKHQQFRRIVKSADVITWNWNQAPL